MPKTPKCMIYVGPMSKNECYLTKFEFKYAVLCIFHQLLMYLEVNNIGFESPITIKNSTISCICSLNIMKNA